MKIWTLNRLSHPGAPIILRPERGRRGSVFKLTLVAVGQRLLAAGDISPSPHGPLLRAVCNVAVSFPHVVSVSVCERGRDKKFQSFCNLILEVTSHHSCSIFFFFFLLEVSH